MTETNSSSDQRSWLVLALGDDRLYGGNEGYADEDSRFYSWNSRVPNSSAIQVGDRIVLWNKKSLIGYGVIERIDHGTGTITQRFCKSCSSSDLRRRKAKLPEWRCQDCFFESNDVHEEYVDVRTFRAHYAKSWINLQGVLTAAEVRPTAKSPRSQHSMRELDWSRFTAALRAARSAR